MTMRLCRDCVVGAVPGLLKVGTESSHDLTFLLRSDQGVQQAITYEGKLQGPTDCEILQAYLSKSLLRAKNFPSYAPGGCTTGVLALATIRRSCIWSIDPRNFSDRVAFISNGTQREIPRIMIYLLQKTTSNF